MSRQRGWFVSLVIRLIPARRNSPAREGCTSICTLPLPFTGGSGKTTLSSSVGSSGGGWPASSFSTFSVKEPSLAGSIRYKLSSSASKLSKACDFLVLMASFRWATVLCGEISTTKVLFLSTVTQNIYNRLAVALPLLRTEPSYAPPATQRLRLLG
jgi:hypothetical protein